MLARAALAAVLVPMGVVLWMSWSEIRRCRRMTTRPDYLPCHGRLGEE